MKLSMRLIAAAALCLGAAGCTSDPTALSAGSTAGALAGVSTDHVASGSAFPDATTGSKTVPGVPNPLTDSAGPAAGGREVIAEPAVADIMMPGPLPEMALGRADAAVTIVQYASLTCPHCRNFHADTFPQMKREYIDTGKVRYILREFPIGMTSGNATIALRCAAPDKYFALYGKFLEQQSSWVSQDVRLDPIFAVAKQVGLTRPQFDACLKNESLIANLKWVKERGRKLGVIGTPNFFVGTKRVKTELTMPEIRALVDPMLHGPSPIAAKQ